MCKFVVIKFNGVGLKVLKYDKLVGDSNLFENHRFKIHIWASVNYLNKFLLIFFCLPVYF